MQFKPFTLLILGLASFAAAQPLGRDTNPADKVIDQLDDLKDVLDDATGVIVDLQKNPLSIISKLPEIIDGVGKVSSLLGDMLPNLPTDDEEFDGDHQIDICTALGPVLDAQSLLLHQITSLISTLPIVGSLLNGLLTTVETLLLTIIDALLGSLPLCNAATNAVAIDFATAQGSYLSYMSVADSLGLDKGDTQIVKVEDVVEEAESVGDGEIE